MTYTFRVVFSGLCAFVPDSPFGPKTPATSALVLLRDLQGGYQIPGKDFVPPHFPMVQFDLRTLRSQQSNQEIDLQDLGMGLCVLDHEDVEIWPGGNPPGDPNMQHDETIPANPNYPQPKEKKSLFWLPKMEQVTKKDVHVKKRLVEPLSEDECFLVARVYLMTGALSTRKLQDGKWGFAPLGKPGDLLPTELQFLSQSLALEMELEGDVTLTFLPFGGDNDDRDYLVLGSISQDPKEIVEVQILNQEFPYPSEGDNDPPPPQDSDFAVYYDFLDGLDAGYPIRVPTQGSNRAVARIGGCTPTAMNRPPATAA